MHTGVLLMSEQSQGPCLCATYPTAVASQRLGELLRQIRHDPGADWSARRMSRQAGMSRTAFFDFFREATGMTPLSYVVEARIERAKELLLNSATPVKQVAQQVGYETASSFSHMFKRHVGSSPVEWRDARRGAADNGDAA